MALCLPAGGALAAMAGLDSMLSYLDGTQDVRYSFSMQAEMLQPYAEETVAMLNGVLKHVSVSAAMTGEGEGARSLLNICVDGQSLMDMTQTQTAQGTELTTSLLPNRTLTSAQSAMDALFGVAQETQFDALMAMQEARACYAALTDAIVPYAEEKKANYKIKNVGSSKWSRIARLSVEQGAELAPLIAQVLGCGMDEAYRQHLSQMTFQKGFIVGLYQTAEGGDDLAVYMKGSAKLADGGTCQLAYQWAFSGEAGNRTQTYKFELTGSKGEVSNRTLSATYREKTSGGTYTLKGNEKAAIKQGKNSVNTTVETDLKGDTGESTRTLSGSVETTVKTTQDGDTDTVVTTLSPKLTLTLSEGSGVLSGTLRRQEKTGKKTSGDLTFTFDDEPAAAFAKAAESGALYIVTDSGLADYAPMPQSSLSLLAGDENDGGDYFFFNDTLCYEIYTPPAGMQTIALDSVTPEQLEALGAELAQNLAGRMLIALAALPAEDAALLSDNMSEEDFNAFLELVKGL